MRAVEVGFRGWECILFIGIGLAGGGGAGTTW